MMSVAMIYSIVFLNNFLIHIVAYSILLNLNRLMSHSKHTFEKVANRCRHCPFQSGNLEYMLIYNIRIIVHLVINKF